MREDLQRPAGAVFVTALMTLAYAVNFMNQGIVLVVAEQIKIDFALSNSQLGIVIGLSYMLFSALGALPLGRIADLKSRSLVVGLSLALMGIATAFTSVVQSYWQLITLRAVAGTGDAGVLPGAVSMIRDHVPVARRPLALSVFNAGASVGALLVYLSMGAVAQAYGWRTAYFCVGILGLIAGALIAAVLPDRLRDAASQPLELSSLHGIRRLLQIPAYVQIVLAFIALGMTSSATWSWVSPVMQRTYGLSVAEASLMLGVGAGVATVLGSLFFGMLASRLRRRNAAAPVRAALAMQVAGAVCFIAGLSSDTGPLAMTLIAVSFFFAGAGMVVVFATIQEVVPTQTGLAVGLAVLLFSLCGQGLGPLVTGAATDHLTSAYGNDALRMAMQIAMILGTLWISFHLARVAGALSSVRSSET